MKLIIKNYNDVLLNIHLIKHHFTFSLKMSGETCLLFYVV